jgi:hypothetical protein
VPHLRQPPSDVVIAIHRRSGSRGGVFFTGMTPLFALMPQTIQMII